MVTSAGHFISLTNFYSFSFFVLELLRYTELRVRREFEWAHTPFFFPDPIWTRNWVWPPPITPFVDLTKTKNPVREVEAVLFFFFLNSPWVFFFVLRIMVGVDDVAVFVIDSAVEIAPYVIIFYPPCSQEVKTHINTNFFYFYFLFLRRFAVWDCRA